eukprot:4511971-Amphidinium_carterae.1
MGSVTWQAFSTTAVLTPTVLPNANNHKVTWRIQPWHYLLLTGFFLSQPQFCNNDTCIEHGMNAQSIESKCHMLQPEVGKGDCSRSKSIHGFLVVRAPRVLALRTRDMISHGHYPVTTGLGTFFE